MAERAGSGRRSGADGGGAALVLLAALAALVGGLQAGGGFTSQGVVSLASALVLVGVAVARARRLRS